MDHYIALIHKEPDSAFGVSFPDFPGCVSAGDTLQEALKGASEVLAFHIEGMIEDGTEIPSPSDVDTIMADPENRDGIAVLVAAPPATERAVRINVTLPSNLLRRIDERASNRSRFLAQAAEHELAGERRS